MERYENIIKIEEIRRLSEDNQYVKAMKVLKTLDTNKIKSLTDLSIIADVYTQNEEYDDAMKILTRIYAKNKTRRIVYQLVDLSIKRGDIYESEYYLDKYKKLSSNDSYQYIFRYCIDKLKQEPYDVLIESLEQLKEYEYFEVWAYELAKLYHKAGLKDKCVRECSDIILWFGNGIYVEKARLLKAYYVGEADPIQMLKAKEKRATEMRLGLDKTKDYSNIRSEIDKFLAENDEKSENNADSKVIPFVTEDESGVTEDEYGVGEIADELLASKDSEEKELISIWNGNEQNSNENLGLHNERFHDESQEISSNRNSAYDELYSAGVFTESNYDEEHDAALEYNEEANEDTNEEVAVSATLNLYRDQSIVEESNDVDEEFVDEEVVEGELPEDEVVEDDSEEDEVVEDDTEEDEVEDEQVQDELVEDEVEDEQVQDVLVKDEIIEDEVGDEQVQNVLVDEILVQTNELEEDEIDHMIHLIHLKENVYLKRIFGYFICNQECSYQIETVLNRLLLKRDKSQNLIVIGQRKSGKTTLGKCYAKALYEQNLIKAPKVAKITATKLNRINLLERVDALVDGTLIIEEAGKLEPNTVEQLMQVIETYVGRILVSLEDEESNIDELLRREEKLSSYFENIIKIPKFSRKDKLGFVLFFLEDQDYKLSEEGKEILLNALEEIEGDVEEAEQLEVLFNFVKKAKLSADQRNKSLLLDIMQSGHLEKNDLLYIKEEDFYD